MEVLPTKFSMHTLIFGILVAGCVVYCYTSAMAQLNVRQLAKRTNDMLSVLVEETGYTKSQIVALAIEKFFWASFSNELCHKLLEERRSGIPEK